MQRCRHCNIHGAVYNFMRQGSVLNTPPPPPPLEVERFVQRSGAFSSSAALSAWSGMLLAAALSGLASLDSREASAALCIAITLSTAPFSFRLLAPTSPHLLAGAPHLPAACTGEEGAALTCIAHA